MRLRRILTAAQMDQPAPSPADLQALAAWQSVIASGPPAPAAPKPPVAAPPRRRGRGRPLGARDKASRGRPRIAILRGVALTEQHASVQQMAQACDLRNAGNTQAAIAKVMGISQGRVSKLLAQARSQGVISSENIAKSDELEHLLWLRDQVVAIIRNPGGVTRAGEPVIDATGQQVVDQDRRLLAINTSINLSTRISKLSGLDAARKTESTVRTAGPVRDPLEGLSMAERVALIKEVAAIHAPRAPAPVDMGEVIVDATAREVSDGNRT